MNQETLLYRVMSGRLCLNIGDSLYYILNVSANIRYQSQRLYEDVLHKYRFYPWMTDKSALRLLVQNGLCTPDIDKNLKTIEQSMDDIKIDMYRSAFNSKDVNNLRTRLDKVRHKYSTMVQNRHSLDYVTTQGFGEMLKQQYVIVHSLHDDNNNRVWDTLQDVKPKLMELVLSGINEDRIDISQMRTIARKDPWRSYWNVNKTNPFSTSPLDLTDDQRTLIMFSKMYDNAFEHPDCPSDDIIDDDDMFDGWMAYNRQKNEKDRTSKQLEDRFSKHKGAGEIFIPVSTKEQAKKVDQLNDTRGRVVKKQRAAAVKKMGKLKDAQLPDRKIDLQQQSNEQFINRVKGK